MQFNYNVKPLDIGAYFRGLDRYEAREEKERKQQEQEQLQQLGQSFLGGDASALEQIAAINLPYAAQLQQFQQSQQPQVATDDEILGAMGSAASFLRSGQVASAQQSIQRLIPRLQNQAQQQEMIGYIQQMETDPQGLLRQYDSAFGGGEKVRATKFLPSYHLMQSTDEGLRIYDINNKLLEGDEAKAVIELNKKLFDEKQQQQINRELRKSALIDAQKRGSEAFDTLGNVRSSISIYDDVISAIDEGASSGRLQSFFPSFKEQTLLLENAGRRLGLNLVSTVTFGSLSEGEMRLAMETAMPNLPPAELKKWAIKKKKAQQKLGRELYKMATTLGRGDTTISEYLEKNNYKEFELDDLQSTEAGSNNGQSDGLTDEERAERDRLKAELNL